MGLEQRASTAYVEVTEHKQLNQNMSIGLKRAFAIYADSSIKKATRFQPILPPLPPLSRDL